MKSWQETRVRSWRCCEGEDGWSKDEHHHLQSWLLFSLLIFYIPCPSPIKENKNMYDNFFPSTFLCSLSFCLNGFRWDSKNFLLRNCLSQKGNSGFQNLFSIFSTFFYFWLFWFPHLSVAVLSPFSWKVKKLLNFLHEHHFIEIIVT